MKTALLLFKRAGERLDAKYFDEVIGLFAPVGIDIDTVEILPEGDAVNFKKRLEIIKSSTDNLIILGGDNSGFDLKEFIAKDMSTELIENDNAVNCLNKVSQKNNKNYSGDYALLPMEATLIPNLIGPFQGFMMEDDVFSLAVLPESKDELNAMTSGFLIPYFENKYKIKKDRFTFKFFGNEKELNRVLEEIKREYGEFSAFVKTSFGDSKVEIVFDEKQNVADIKRQIILKLKENIYAEYDVGLSERLFDVLKLKNMKISVAESFTGGRVVSSLIKNSGASAYINEGIVSYSNKSKMKRLGVSEENLNTLGAVSLKVAYEMSAGLLNTGDCDISIATTGLAGPKSDDTNKPVGLCFIAVGHKTGIHVYKYVLSGDREEITETAKNTALFLAIKLLKNL